MMQSLDSLRLLDKLADVQSSASLSKYLDHVVIDSVPPGRFTNKADQWQIDHYKTLVPAAHALALGDGYSGPTWFYRGMPRGHDKTSGLARFYHWLLGYSHRRLRMYHIAGDKDQGAELQLASEAELALNPWLAKRVRWNRFGEAYGPGGTLYVLSADAASNMGKNPDVVSADELTHWLHAKGEDNWNTIIGSMNKRPGSLLLVITNAGVLDSWQHSVRQAARTTPALWSFEEVPEYTTWASWMSPEKQAAIIKMMTPAEAKRVIWNVWINAAEDMGYLTPEEIDACELLGKSLGLTERTRGERDQRYYLSVDYGPKKDRTALAVLHRDTSTGIVVVDRLDVLQGTPTNPVRVATVADWIRDKSEKFGTHPDLILDPYQMVGTKEEFESHQVVTEHEARGGKGNYEMAECLRSLVVNNMAAWYPGCGRLLLPSGRIETLADEMKGLITRRMSYGYRFDHESGKHDDRTTAIGMGSLLAAPDYNPSWVKPVAIERKSTPVKFDRGLAVRDGGAGRGLYGMGRNR